MNWIKLLMAVVAIFVFWGYNIWADTLQLKDGSIIRGTIKEENEKSITIETSYGSLTIEREKISEIKKETDILSLKKLEEDQKRLEISISQLDQKIKFQQEKITSAGSHMQSALLLGLIGGFIYGLGQGFRSFSDDKGDKDLGTTIAIIGFGVSIISIIDQYRAGEKLSDVAQYPYILPQIQNTSAKPQKGMNPSATQLESKEATFTHSKGDLSSILPVTITPFLKIDEQKLTLLIELDIKAIPEIKPIVEGSTEFDRYKQDVEKEIDKDGSSLVKSISLEVAEGYFRGSKNNPVGAKARFVLPPDRWYKKIEDLIGSEITVELRYFKEKKSLRWRI